MEGVPSRVLEAVVGLLIPPACREYVLGDLHERYRCTRQYIGDAARTVPCVVMSRIRRTTDPQVFLLEALALYLSFVGGAWILNEKVFLQAEGGFLRLAIPTGIALMALMLGDAYAKPGKRSRLRPVQDAALCIGLAFLSQATLLTADREWAVPRQIMIYGGGISVLLVATLRLLFPPDANRPRGAT